MRRRPSPNSKGSQNERFGRFLLLSSCSARLTYHRSKSTVAAETRPGLWEKHGCFLNIQMGDVG